MIIQETTRTLEGKLGWPPALTLSLQRELQAHFSTAWIRDFEPQIPRMTNDAKDRHVSAAAVHCEASAIVTFNLRQFEPQHLERWGVRVLHPQLFFIELFAREPLLMRAKLEQQAMDRARSYRQLLDILNKTVPAFVAEVSRSQ